MFSNVIPVNVQQLVCELMYERGEGSTIYFFFNVSVIVTNNKYIHTLNT